MRNQDYEQSDYSENKLDIAFIAEDSREVRSVSMCSSEGDSISGISKIHSNHLSNSPFLNFEPQISSMEEWPLESPDIFGKKFQKRNSKSESIPQEIQESNEEERQIEKLSKCTKKRMGERMKVITIGATTVEVMNQVKTNPYPLRSKNKDRRIIYQSADDSSDELRRIVEQIDGKDNRRNGAIKCSQMHKFTL